MSADVAPAPELAVVIPALDAEHVLPRQLRALAGQEVTVPWEVIVADNGSGDGTREVVRAAARDFPVPLRLVDASDRPGAAHARNRGVLATRARYVAFCDADDRVARSWLAAAHAGLRRWDAVGGPMLDARDESVVRGTSVLSGVLGPQVLTGNLAVRRDLLLRAGGFDTSLPRYGGEDSELFVRLHGLGVSVGECPEMVMAFQPTPPGPRALRKVLLAGVAEVEIWRRHPQVFVDQQRPGWVAREIVALPRTACAAWRVAGARRAGRQILRVIAHVAAVRSLRRTARPQLLDAGDAAGSARGADA